MTISFKKWEGNGDRKLDICVLLSGCISGVVAGFITTPIDVIKTRMMVNTVKEYEIMLTDWFMKIVREEGVKSLFKGCFVRVLYLGLGGMLYFGTYVAMLRLFGADKEYRRFRS